MSMARTSAARVSRADRILLMVKDKARVTAGLRKGLLYSFASSHILAGVLVEGTSYKDTVYVWRVCMPLYRPARQIVLNYSERLSLDGRTHFTGTAAEIADSIDASIRSAGLTYEELLSMEISIEEFYRKHVEWIDWGHHNVIPRIFDAGATFAIVGEFERARVCFERCLADLPEGHPMWTASNAYLDAISSKGDSVLQIALRLETETRVALGLQRTASSAQATK
jgi:hypothetical protein